MSGHSILSGAVDAGDAGNSGDAENEADSLLSAGPPGGLAADIPDGRDLPWTQMRDLLVSVSEQITIALEQAQLIEQHQERTVELERQNTLLDQAHRESEMVAAQKEYLAVMSHELRTPLFACSALGALLLDSALLARHVRTSEGAEMANLVHALNKSTAILVDTVNNILDFSKYENEAFELEQRPFALHETVESAVEIVCMQDSACEFPDVTFRVDAAVPRRVVGDEMRVRQILTNLLSNACKFTPRGGLVSCTVALAAPAADAARVALEVRVVDTGCGVEEKHLQLLFHKFQQLDQSVTRKYGGTGLGLAITKQLAQLMNGSIHVERNTDAPQGACFVVRLELGRVATTEAVTRSDSIGDGFRAAVVARRPEVAAHISQQCTAGGFPTPPRLFFFVDEFAAAVADGAVFDSVIADVSPFCDARLLSPQPLKASSQPLKASIETIGSPDDGASGTVALATSPTEVGWPASPNDVVLRGAANARLDGECERSVEQFMAAVQGVRKGLLVVLCDCGLVRDARRRFADRRPSPAIIGKPLRVAVTASLFRLWRRYERQTRARAGSIVELSATTAAVSARGASTGTSSSESTPATATSPAVSTVSPLATAAPQNATQPSASGVDSPEARSRTTSVSNVTAGTPLQGRPVPPTLRVLVVEDNKIIQMVLCKMLEKLGLRCDVAADGVEALALVKTSSTYDVVFMDHMMPNMDGITATQCLRERFQQADASGSAPGNDARPWVCVLTANSFAVNRLAYQQAGMNDCVTKPATIEDLRAALLRFLDHAARPGILPIASAP